MSRVTRAIAIVCFILLILLIPAALGSWLRSLTSDIFYGVFSLMIAAVLLIAYASARGDRERRSQTISSKIAALQQKEFALHREQSQDLSKKDLSSLKAYKVIVLSIVGAIGLMIIGIITITSARESMKLVASASAVVIFLVIELEINKRMNLTFEQGKKIIVRGVVTKRYTAVDDSGHDHKPHHWLHIGDRKVKVEVKIYGAYDVGDAVEFHVFERYGTVILHHEKLEGAGIQVD